MKIDSEILRERLNDKSIIDWMDSDRSPQHYKQGYLSGLIKALAILGEVEYFTEHGEDREPIDFEFDEDTVKGLKALTGAVADKAKALELSSHSEKRYCQYVHRVNGRCSRKNDGIHGNDGA